MALSHDVVLPADQRVVWPPLCPACGADRPTDLLPVSRHRSSLATFFWPFLYLFARRHHAQVPICTPCRGQQLRSRWLRLLALIALAAAVTAFAMPWAKELTASRGLQKLVVLGVALAALAPVILWQVLRPPAVDITVGKDTVQFEFARRDYADAFAATNRFSG